MAEVAGIVLGIIPFVVAGVERYGSLKSVVAEIFAESQAHTTWRGLIISYCLKAYFPNVALVMDRVERYVLHAGDHEIIAFMKSYTSSFNMIGVAGAIIAQVAITALSLAGLPNSHWTAEAFFIVSLVTGSLSVFFACAISPAFHGLHSAEDIKDFLTRPPPAANNVKFNSIITEIRTRNCQPTVLSGDEMTKLRSLVEQDRWTSASPYAALMLVTPMTLLHIALNAFLIGLGIYLGELYTAKLIPSYGPGSLGILVFYLASALFGIGMFYIARSLKYLENTPLRRWERVLDDQKRLAKRRQQMRETHTHGQRGTEPPSGSNYFRQSRHIRDGNRIRFTDEDETVHRSSSQNEHEMDERPGEAIEDCHSLPVTEKAALDTAVPSEMESSPRISPGHVEQILKDLIKTQEENLRLNRRLLEAFSMR